MLGILLNGCTHPFYAPNSAHIPILKEKNDLRLSLAYIETTDGWSSGKGAEIQGAYAAGSNLGILFNAFTATGTEDGESGKGSYGEVGAGYFKLFGAKSQLIFEAYSGIGLGGAENNYADEGYIKNSIFKYFIQPSISFSSNHFEFSFGSRLSFVNTSVKELNLINSQNSNYLNDDLAYLEQNHFSVIWEPGVNLAAGFKNFKPLIGLCTSINLSHPDFPQSLWTASLGFRINNSKGK